MMISHLRTSYRKRLFMCDKRLNINVLMRNKNVGVVVASIE